MDPIGTLEIIATPRAIAGRATQRPTQATRPAPVDGSGRRTMQSPRRAVAPLALASLLAACGGGGGGGEGGGGGASLSINGTAATGPAIAGATVAAKCAAGSGSATTSSSGSFDMKIAGGASPCVLRVSSGGGALHSLVPAGSSGATANLTPLSELIVARVNGGDPDALFTTFDAAGQARLTQDAAGGAQAAVIAALRSAVDLTGLNPIAGDASIGGTLDQKLDAFVALLAARGVTLGNLTAAIETGSTDAATRLLQPAAASCDGLRSGGVRLVAPAGARTQGVTQFDATTLSYVLPDGTTGTLTDNGGCSFTTADGTAVLISTRSGFTAAVAPPRNGNPPFLFFGIPEQTILLPELAGTWNYVAYLTTTAVLALKPTTGYFSLDAAGKAGNNFSCVNLDPCTDAGSVSDLTVAAGGGFQRSSAAGTEAYYVFKTDSGRYTMVSFLSNGYLVATKQVARALPAVGDVTLLRSLTVDTQAAASAITDSSYTVLSVDANAQSFTRQRQQDGRMETFAINSPRAGLVYRQPGDAPAIVALPLPGSAASVFTSADVAHNFFGVSIQHP